MIELNMRELVESVDVFQYIIDKPMRAKLAYKIASIVEEVEKQNIKYNNIRNQLIEKYAKRDENGVLIQDNGNYTVPPDKISIFNDELNEFLDTEITLTVEKLEIQDIENMELSPRQVLKMKKYIKKEEA